jgi:hypothetical protein
MTAIAWRVTALLFLVPFVWLVLAIAIQLWLPGWRPGHCGQGCYQ